MIISCSKKVNSLAFIYFVNMNDKCYVICKNNVLLVRVNINNNIGNFITYFNIPNMNYEQVIDFLLLKC